MSEIFGDLKRKALHTLRPAVAGLAIAAASLETGPQSAVHAQEAASKTTAEEILKELGGTNFQDGSKKIIEWAGSLPYEILAVYFEIPNKEGKWLDVRGGSYTFVDGPSYEGNTPSVKILKEYIQRTGTKELNVCITHTHTRNYLERLKKGALSTQERRQRDRLGTTLNVPKSVDPRGFTDLFNAKGPFATPQSALDIKNNKNTLLALDKLAIKLGIRIQAIESVTNMLGIWYMRTCVGGECQDFSMENQTNSDRTSVERLQANWVKFVNTTKNTDGKYLSGQEILDSDQHKQVVRGYAAHGIKVWFVPKERVPELKSCMGTF